jgi:hypothetical protein
MFFLKNDVSHLSIWFFANLFIGWSWCAGIRKTIQLIRTLAPYFPLRNGKLEIFSKKIDVALSKIPFLFLARKQTCLIRGFLLFFYGKRLGEDIHFYFGCQWEQEIHKVHCWIEQNGQIQFEVPDVINKYTALMEYH